MLIRLWPRGALFAALATGCFGCAGQNVEGAWRGPLPFYDAKACVTKLDSRGRFESACGGYRLVAAGAYRWDGRLLRLRFAAFARDGRPLRPPGEMALAVRGEGNTMRLRYGQTPLIWRRAPP